MLTNVVSATLVVSVAQARADLEPPRWNARYVAVAPMAPTVDAWP